MIAVASCRSAVMWIEESPANPQSSLRHPTNLHLTLDFSASPMTLSDKDSIIGPLCTSCHTITCQMGLLEALQPQGSYQCCAKSSSGLQTSVTTRVCESSLDANMFITVSEAAIVSVWLPAIIIKARSNSQRFPRSTLFADPAPACWSRALSYCQEPSISHHVIERQKLFLTFVLTRLMSRSSTRSFRRLSQSLVDSLTLAHLHLHPVSFPVCFIVAAPNTALLSNTHSLKRTKPD